jgi:TonB family protein
LSQSVALTLLLLIPLFGRTERIVVKGFVPMPPYGYPPHRSPVGDTSARHDGPPITDDRFTFHPPTQPWHPRSPIGGDPVAPEGIGPGGPATADGPGCSWCVNIGDQSKGPLPPQQETTVRQKPQILKMTTIDPAMLIHRVEPIYPPLAKQMHMEGRVELHAIIATDGTIQSLQVVSGAPLFIQSATEGVRQWRYRPTYLNGQPVEIDTYITVVYTLQH